MGFKKSRKSSCKKCRNKHSGQRGRGFKSLIKKAGRFAKKAAKLDLAKMAVSQGLAYAPKLLDFASSKVKNKKLKGGLSDRMT